ncbi:hypothetical protein ACI2I3_00720 [Psychrobacter namhaensis]|uniref:Uncharacterized protein n=1 Tax=Psychrobacter namhaensis TaxID=292734 RepID=A0ABW8L5Y4_9GAMM
MTTFHVTLVLFVFVVYNAGLYSGRRLERLDIKTNTPPKPLLHELLNLAISLASLLLGAYTVSWFLG